MPSPNELECWIEELSSAFGNLSNSQRQVLGIYSYGMAITQRCGQTIICVFLAMLLKLNSNNVRQRLKEFLYEREQKRGAQRRELDLEAQFEPLTRWLLQKWQDKKHLVLAVDATYLKDRHIILCISLVYRQIAIPLAWKVLLAHHKGEWHPLWLNLLAHIAPAFPSNSQVLLLFDRGLYSKRLFEAVRTYGWHPMMRIREQGLYKRPKSKTWHSLKTLTKRGMKACTLKVQCFKGDPVEAVLWLQWHQDQAEPCLLLCDLAPRQLKGNPYPLRMWIEASFKDWKRGGFHLEQAKTVDPNRLARLIFVLAIASIYLLRSGNALFHIDPFSPSDPTTRLSILSLGWIHALVSSIRGFSLIQLPFPFFPYQFPPFFLPQKTYP